MSLIAATPPISPDWGIAIAILIVGVGVIWKWAVAKDTNEDALHNARLLDYQSRERVAAERETFFRGHLNRQSKDLADLRQTYSQLLGEMREVRRIAHESDNATRERLGKLQRETAVVMMDARDHYKALNERVILLADAIARKSPPS